MCCRLSTKDFNEDRELNIKCGLSHFKTGLHKKSFSVSSAAGSILVLVLGHWLMRNEIEEELQQLGISDDFKFSENDLAFDCQGAQWPAVAIIIDGSTNMFINSAHQSIITAATRATTSLLFIYHDAQETMKS